MLLFQNFQKNFLKFLKYFFKFCFQLKSSIKCQKCTFTSSRFQTELCLHLPVPTDDQFLVNFLIYDQTKSAIKECKISIPNKGKKFLVIFFDLFRAYCLRKFLEKFLKFFSSYNWRFDFKNFRNKQVQFTVCVFQTGAL